MIYDIANNAFVVGQTLEDVEPHVRHLVQDVVEGQNIDRVSRVMSLAFCRVKELLHRWMVDDDEEYVIRLVVKGGLQRCTIDYWAILAYEYVTTSAIADWLDVTAKDKAEVWRVKAEKAAELLVKGVAGCHGHARKRMEVV